MGNLRTRLIRIRKEEPPGPTITPQRSVVAGTQRPVEPARLHSDWKDALMPLHAHHLHQSPHIENLFQSSSLSSRAKLSAKSKSKS